jgi:DNA modification methylase
MLYNDDCFKILPKLDKKAKLILTDPPYFIANEVKITRSKNGQKFKKGKDISHDFGEWDKFESLEKFYEFTYSWLDLVDERLADGGMFVCFFDRDKINKISEYMQIKGYKIKGYFAYIKANPVPQSRKVKFMNGWEEAIMLQKQPTNLLTFNYQLGQQPDYIMLPICSGKERTVHPTQKPEKLMNVFIEYFTNENDLVIDPFMDSGTVPACCKKLNRQFIGIEKDEEYFKIAKERLDNIPNQQSLF